MKKSKMSILFNIAMLCLSICAIAVGVYAAKSATLNVTGSVGFTEHDCSVQVTGTVTGATQTVAQYNQSSTTGGTLQDWAIGNLTFDDTKATLEPIVITFTITNNTPEFGVSVRIVNMPSGNDRITVDLQHDATYIAMKGTGTAQSKTITITFTLLDDNTSVTNTISLNNLQLKIDKKTDPGFEYSIATLNDYEVDGYDSSAGAYYDNPRVVTTNKLVVNMGKVTEGTVTNKDVRWYAFAVKGYDTGKVYVHNNTVYDNRTNNGNLEDRWYSLYNVDMSNFDVTGKTFWFVQEYVTAGGYTATGGYVTGQYYDNTDPKSNIYKNDTENGTSDIYTYISGTSNDGEYVTTKLGISSNPIYSKIDNRQVTETYNTTYNGESGTQTNNFTSKLWLLSQAELGLAYGSQWKSYSENNNTYMCKAITYGISQTPGTGYGAVWWLRSPYPSYSDFAYYVFDNGDLDRDYVDEGDYGVRSAFQIQMQS